MSVFLSLIFHFWLLPSHALRQSASYLACRTSSACYLPSRRKSDVNCISLKGDSAFFQEALRNTNLRLAKFFDSCSEMNGKSLKSSRLQSTAFFESYSEMQGKLAALKFSGSQLRENWNMIMLDLEFTAYRSLILDIYELDQLSVAMPGSNFVKQMEKLACCLGYGFSLLHDDDGKPEQAYVRLGLLNNLQNSMSKMCKDKFELEFPGLLVGIESFLVSKRAKFNKACETLSSDDRKALDMRLSRLKANN